MSESSEPESIKSALFHYREIPAAENKSTGPKFDGFKVKSYGLMTFGSISNMMRQALAEDEAARQPADTGMAATIIQHNTNESIMAEMTKYLNQDPEERKKQDPTREEMAQLKKDLDALLERLDREDAERKSLGKRGA